MRLPRSIVGSILEDLRRGGHDHLPKLLGFRRKVGHKLVDRTQASLDQLAPAVDMSPDSRAVEDLVPEGVVPVIVGVEDPSDRERVMCLRSDSNSSACPGWDRVSITSTASPPITRPMFWSRNSYRRRKMPSPSSCQPVGDGHRRPY